MGGSDVTILPSNRANFYRLRRKGRTLLRSNATKASVRSCQRLLLYNAFGDPHSLFPRSFSRAKRRRATIASAGYREYPFCDAFSNGCDLVGPYLFAGPLGLFFMTSMLGKVLFFRIDVPLRGTLSVYSRFSPAVDECVRVVSTIKASMLVLLCLICGGHHFTNITFARRIVQRLQDIFLFFAPSVPSYFFRRILGSR